MGAWGGGEPGDDYYPNAGREVFDGDGKKLTVHQVDRYLMEALTKWRNAYMKGAPMLPVEADLLRAIGMYERVHGGMVYRYG